MLAWFRENERCDFLYLRCIHVKTRRWSKSFLDRQGHHFLYDDRRGHADAILVCEIHKVMVSDYGYCLVVHWQNATHLIVHFLNVSCKPHLHTSYKPGMTVFPIQRNYDPTWIGTSGQSAADVIWAPIPSIIFVIHLAKLRNKMFTQIFVILGLKCIGVFYNIWQNFTFKPGVIFNRYIWYDQITTDLDNMEMF